jgi:predicted metalloendopeptidase
MVRNNGVLQEILDSLAYAPTRYARSHAERDAGVFYRSCMDTAFTATDILRSIAPELRRIERIRSRSDFSAEVGRMHRGDVYPLFWFVAINDYFDPTHVMGEVRRLNGWALPTPGHYLRADSAAARTRDEYVATLTHVFAAIGDAPDSAAANARRVLAVETALARSNPRDGGAVNHKMSLPELAHAAPAFDWREYVNALGRPDMPPINLRPPSVLGVIDSLVSSIPLADWRAYLRWTLVNNLAPTADKLLGPEVAAFLNGLKGTQGGPPRAFTCARGASYYVGTGLGRAFVARTSSPQVRSAAIAMVENIRAVLRDQLKTLPWLSETTRMRALAKLAAIKMQIGYPDRWPSVPPLNLRYGPAAATLLAVRKADFSRIGKEVERGNWFDAPTDASATYYDTDNTISITAAMLQKPFFDPGADPATNYGAIGFTIGHEMTHAFDSNGRLYDELGAKRDWWTSEDAAEFDRRAQLVVSQYNAYVVVDTIHQNGRATLSENLADIGGLKLAWLAYQRATAGQPGTVIDGYTPEQRFFYAFAQSTFRRITRPQQLRIQASQDNHSAPQWRVNGPLANLPEFAAAFRCKDSDAMVRASALRGNIW